MKIEIALLLITLLSIKTTYSQDIIYLNDGSEINAKVYEITIDLIKYKNYDELDGPLRNINIKDVFKIKYENGKQEMFNNPSQPQDIQVKELETSSINSNNDNNENTIKASTIEFNFGGKVGFFIPSANEAMMDIYGSGFTWGLYTGLWINRLGFALNFRSFSKDGDPYTYGSVQSASSHISINQITLSGLYKFSENKIVMTYGGGGLGYASINETLDLTAFGSSASAEGQLSSVELHFMGGIRIKPIYFEVTFSSLPYNGDVNFGGIILSGGLIF